MAKSIECKCDPRFTCGYCLRNMKPYFFTPTKERRDETPTVGGEVPGEVRPVVPDQGQ